MKIRKQVFETNSSSSHTLTIAKRGGKINQTIKPVDGVVKIMTGEYGWEFESYYTANEKASYVATAIVNAFTEDRKQELLKRFIRVMKEVTNAIKVIILPISGEFKYERTFRIFDHLNKQLSNQGAMPLLDKNRVEESAVKARDDEEEEWGYIDHQSSPYENSDWVSILDSDEGMKVFLFSNESSFETGNDNE